MANTKGTRRENVIVPMIGTEPLAKPIPIRFDSAMDARLRAMGRSVQQFVRDAVREKEERDAAIALQQEEKQLQLPQSQSPQDL